MHVIVNLNGITLHITFPFKSRHGPVVRSDTAPCLLSSFHSLKMDVKCRERMNTYLAPIAKKRMSFYYFAQLGILRILATCIIVALGLFFGHCLTGLSASPLSPLNANAKPISCLCAAPRRVRMRVLHRALPGNRCYKESENVILL